VIDWPWFEAYFKRLRARKATGKTIVPEIYQRYLSPNEEVYTLTKNTYGRIAGGRIWMDYFCNLMYEPPLHFDRIPIGIDGGSVVPSVINGVHDIPRIEHTSWQSRHADPHG
jgi:hypothetical protein